MINLNLLKEYTKDEIVESITTWYETYEHIKKYYKDDNNVLHLINEKEQVIEDIILSIERNKILNEIFK